MKVSRSILVVSVIVYLSIVITSCDKVDGPYSEPQGSGIDTTDTNQVDPNPSDTVSGTVYDTSRNVLLEDYTGHKCQGCPAAHEEAYNVQALLGSQLVVMAVHVGFWANTNASGSFTYDFETQTSVDLYGALVPSTQAFPTGTVNRKFFGATRIVDYPQWGNQVNQLLQDSSDAAIKVVPLYNSATRVISAYVKTTFLNDLTGDYALAIYYTEDSIVNWQAFPAPPGGPGNTPDYVHRHVLRGSLTSTWGSVIATDPVAGHKVIGTITGTPIASDIVPEHVHVIAVLTDNTTKEVIQVKEVPLFP